MRILNTPHSAVVDSLLLAVALVATGPFAVAHAASFRVLATVDGGPVVGAVIGTTVYGTTPYGGIGNGTLFSVDDSGAYTQLHAFDGSNDGMIPNGQLAVDASGNLYGTAEFGGLNNSGTLWEFSAGSMSTLQAMGSDKDGTQPLQGPVIDANGTLYGTDAAGTPTTNGGVFAWSPASGFAMLYVFQSHNDGHCPFSGLARAKTGNLYGTTVGNGAGGQPTGSIWRLNASGKLKTMYSFQDGADGEYPNQAPVLDRAGNIWGTTHIQAGGAFSGAIWRMTKGGVFNVMHSFNAATDGSSPNSPLALGHDGKLYGTTHDNGPGGWGTVYSISGSGAFTVVHGFADGSDGLTPSGNLVATPGGQIYGAVASGQVFRIDP